MNEEITKQVDELAARAAGLIVIDRATAEKADLLIALGKDMIKKIKSHYREVKQAQDEAKRKILRMEELDLLKVEPTVTALDNSLSSWRMEERRKAAEVEEKRLAEERRRKELEEEALRKAQEEERKAREAIERAAFEQDAAARKKAQDEAAEARAKADKILEQAAAEESKFEPPPPTVAPPAAMAHSYERKVFRFRVQQPALVPRDLCKPDEVKIGKAVSDGKAAGMKASEIKIGGVEIWEEIENVRRRT